VNLLSPIVAASEDDGGFHAPSIDEFFPPAIFFEGTIFEINRIIIIRLIVVIAILIIFYLGTRRMKMVPTRFQSMVEYGFDFVRVSIAEELLGKKEGRRFLPILTAMFIMILFMNITSIIPGLNIAGTSLIGVPLTLAIVSYVTFIYAGIKKSPKNFFKNSLFPAGVPWPIYFIVTPIEFISTFIIRPVTLSLRLLMNMLVGHLLLVLFFSATSFFLFTAGGWFTLLAIPALAFGLAFTVFEILVALLQAYVFTLLTGVYIQLALAEEH
jgi:F-type H+-transporting ATPase subunit a